MDLVKEIVLYDDATIEKVKNEAELAANEAQSHYLSVHGEDSYCGFGWVTVIVSRTNSREAKALEKIGFKKSWQRKRMDNWSPGNYRGQSMSVREIGATAYAQVLTNYGFKAYSESRAD
jgi:hypothetical protein|tara:strand:+ start:66 stop:422 length:357 start_codon:yes stop_codon:yes gene_type:complete